jgi:hypothetical protein
LSAGIDHRAQIAGPIALLMALFVVCGLHAAPVGDAIGAVAFGPGSGRTWFSGCELQAERYVVCKNADRPLLDAIAAPGAGTPGQALQAFMRKIFETRGCRFEAPDDSFRVNGIFLSFDAGAAAHIRCEGARSALQFAPDRMSLLDTVYFLMADAPPL